MKHWHGGTDCDICREPIKGELFDARTRQGIWGTLCKKHFNMLGTGLGTGKGQRYQEQPDGSWLLVEGGST